MDILTTDISKLSFKAVKEKVDEIKDEKIKVNKEGEIFIIVAIGLFITIAIVVIMMIKKYRK